MALSRKKKILISVLTPVAALSPLLLLLTTLKNNQRGSSTVIIDIKKDPNIQNHPIWSTLDELDKLIKALDTTHDQDLVDELTKIFNDTNNLVKDPKVTIDTLNKANQTLKNKINEILSNKKAENKAYLDKFNNLEKDIRDYSTTLNSNQFANLINECLEVAQNIKDFIKPYENIISLNNTQKSDLNAKYDEFIGVFAKLQYKENAEKLEQNITKTDELITYFESISNHEFKVKLDKFKETNNNFKNQKTSIKPIEAILTLQDLEPIKNLNQLYDALINEMEYEKYRIEFNSKVDDLINNPNSNIDNETKEELKNLTHELDKIIDTNIKNNPNDKDLLDKTKDQFDNLFNEKINKTDDNNNNKESDEKLWSDKLNSLISEIENEFIPNYLNELGTKNIKDNLLASLEINRLEVNEQNVAAKYNNLLETYNLAKENLEQHNLSKELLNTTIKLLENVALKYANSKYESLLNEINNKLTQSKQDLNNLSTEDLIKANESLKDYISSLPNKELICEALDQLKNTIKQAKGETSSADDSFESILNNELNDAIINAENKLNEFNNQLFNPDLTVENIQKEKEVLESKFNEVSTTKNEREKIKNELDKLIKDIQTYKDTVLNKDDKSANMYSDLIAKLDELINNSNVIKDTANNNKLKEQINNTQQSFDEVKATKNNRDEENGLIKNLLDDSITDAENWIKSNFDENSNSEIKNELENVINNIKVEKEANDADNDKLNSLRDQLNMALENAKVKLTEQNKAKDNLNASVNELKNYVDNNLRVTPFDEINNALGLDNKINEIKNNIDNYSTDELNRLNEEIKKLLADAQKAKSDKEHQIAFDNLNKEINESKEFLAELNNSANENRYQEIANTLDLAIKKSELNLTTQSTQELINNLSELQEAYEKAQNDKLIKDNQLFNAKVLELNNKKAEALNALVVFDDNDPAQKAFKDELKTKIESTSNIEVLSANNINNAITEIDNKIVTLEQLIADANTKNEYFNALNNLKSDLEKAKETLGNLPADESDSRNKEIKDALDKVIKEVENNLNNENTNVIKENNKKLNEAVDNAKNTSENVAKENNNKNLSDSINKAKELLDDLQNNNTDNKYDSIIDELNKIIDESEKQLQNSNNTSDQVSQHNKNLNNAIDKAQKDKEAKDHEIALNNLNSLLSSSKEYLNELNSPANQNRYQEIANALDLAINDSELNLEAQTKEELINHLTKLQEALNKAQSDKTTQDQELFNNKVAELNNKKSQVLSSLDVFDDADPAQKTFKEELKTKIESTSNIEGLSADDINNAINEINSKIATLEQLLTESNTKNEYFGTLKNLKSNLATAKEILNNISSDESDIRYQETKDKLDKVIKEVESILNSDDVEIIKENNTKLTQVINEVKSDLEYLKLFKEVNNIHAEGSELEKKYFWLDAVYPEFYHEWFREFHVPLHNTKTKIQDADRTKDKDALIKLKKELTDLISKTKEDKKPIDLALFNAKITERENAHQDLINNTLSQFDLNDPDQKSQYQKIVDLANAEMTKVDFDYETASENTNAIIEHTKNIAKIKEQALDLIKFFALKDETLKAIKEKSDLIEQIKDETDSRYERIRTKLNTNESLINSALDSYSSSLLKNRLDQLKTAIEEAKVEIANLKRESALEDAKAKYIEATTNLNKLSDEFSTDIVAKYNNQYLMLSEALSSEELTLEEIQSIYDTLNTMMNDQKAEILKNKQDIYNRLKTQHDQSLELAKSEVLSKLTNASTNQYEKDINDYLNKEINTNKELPAFDNDNFKNVYDQIIAKQNNLTTAITNAKQGIANYEAIKPSVEEFNSLRSEYKEFWNSLLANKTINQFDYFDLITKYKQTTEGYALPILNKLIYQYKSEDFASIATNYQMLIQEMNTTKNNLYRDSNTLLNNQINDKETKTKEYIATVVNEVKKYDTSAIGTPNLTTKVLPGLENTKMLEIENYIKNHSGSNSPTVSDANNLTTFKEKIASRDQIYIYEDEMRVLANNKILPYIESVVKNQYDWKNKTSNDNFKYNGGYKAKYLDDMFINWDKEYKASVKELDTKYDLSNLPEHWKTYSKNLNEIKSNFDAKLNTLLVEVLNKWKADLQDNETRWNEWKTNFEAQKAEIGLYFNIYWEWQKFVISNMDQRIKDAHTQFDALSFADTYNSDNFVYSKYETARQNIYRVGKYLSYVEETWNDSSFTHIPTIEEEFPIVKETIARFKVLESLVNGDSGEVRNIWYIPAAKLYVDKFYGDPSKTPSGEQWYEPLKEFEDKNQRINEFKNVLAKINNFIEKLTTPSTL